MTPPDAGLYTLQEAHRQAAVTQFLAAADLPEEFGSPVDDAAHAAEPSTEMQARIAQHLAEGPPTYKVVRRLVIVDGSATTNFVAEGGLPDAATLAQFSTTHTVVTPDKLTTTTEVVLTAPVE